MIEMSVFSIQDHYPDSSRSVNQLYNEILDQAQLADQLGFDTVWVAEHHFSDYGVVPNPAVMMAAMARSTKRIGIGAAIAILSFHDPRTLAENYAMVDQLSGGRLRLGVGSGYLPHEFRGYGLDPQTKHARYEESLPLVLRLLNGERVTHKGQFCTLEDVAINVLPVQKKIELYAAVTRKGDAPQAVGARGYNMLLVPYITLDRIDEVREIIADHALGRARAKLPYRHGSTGVAMHMHVARSDAEAREIAEPAFDIYLKTRARQRWRGYDHFIDSGLVLFGSVRTVAQRLVDLHGLGVENVLSIQNFGCMSARHVEHSMRLLMAEVMPLVRERIAAAEPARAAVNS